MMLTLDYKYYCGNQEKSGDRRQSDR